MTTQNSALAARLSRQKRLDGAFVWTTKLSALLVLLTLGGIMLSLVFGAIPSIREFGLNFYTSSNWDPVAGQFGALAPIYGTIVTSIIAVVIAVPVSFGIAVFLTELCPNFLKSHWVSPLSCWLVFHRLSMVCGVCLSLPLGSVIPCSHG